MKQRLSPKVAPLLLVAIEQRNWQNGQLGIDLPQAPPPGHTTSPAGVFFLRGDQNISTDPVHKDKLDQVQLDGRWTYGTAAPGQDNFYKAGDIRQTDEYGTPLRDAEGRIIYVDRGRVEYDWPGSNDLISRGAGGDYLWGGPRGGRHGSCVLRHSHQSMRPVAVSVELIRERLAWAGGKAGYFEAFATTGRDEHGDSHLTPLSTEQWGVK